MSYSVLNLDHHQTTTSLVLDLPLAPFEITSLLIEAIAWCSMLIMIGLETKVYIKEFTWCVRFGVIYVLVGDAVMFNFVLTNKGFSNIWILLLYMSEVICQVFFGILLLFYNPSVEPYPGYVPLMDESAHDTDYEVLPGEDSICPERHASIFSKIHFGWMTPLMKQGFKRPITEKDVWKLDTWDQTETLNSKFQICWLEESQKSKPWLLRALNSSVGERYAEL
ncbi:Abc transporter c family member [Thalictrum thalictroides]|uniref:Abc transporter c family member n=1 Tax=Thalictrum thalictroides TaxID=46969 RepID=A0A7J6W4Q7_THATH|nr:Abc transporter c family member [Thalictrum thalictroides]